MFQVDHGSTTFLHSKNKKWKQRKKKSLKAETIKRLSQRSKCYFFSHSRASRNFLVGQPKRLTILFSVPWLLDFEIHFAGSFSYLKVSFSANSFGLFLKYLEPRHSLEIVLEKFSTLIGGLAFWAYEPTILMKLLL